MNRLEGTRFQYSTLPRRLRALALLCVTLGLILLAPSQAFADSIISKVDVTGSLRVEKKTILSGLETKKGTTFSEDAVTRDLRKIWDQGFFKDVSFHRKETADGLEILIKVREKPAIRKVIYRGNDNLSEEDLSEVVDVKPLTILNVEHLKANVQKIKDLYKDKGFYLADIEYKTEAVGKSGRSVDIAFEVTEGLKVTVRQLAFIGNKELPDSLLKSVLQVREGNEFSFMSKGGTFKEEHFQTDLMRLQAVYYDHGFVAVKVGQPTIALSPDKRFIYISVPIEEGLRYNIGNISFGGDFELEAGEIYSAVDEEMLRTRMQTEPGELFTRTGLFEDINRLTDVYKNRGYAYANVTPNSSLNPETKTVDLEMLVEKGDLVYVERIDIVGNTRTRDKVIRREMRLFEGELYSELAVKSSKARIFQLGFFETVEITTAPGLQADTVKLSVEIKEKSTGTFQVGAGFSSVESFIATAQISQNNFLGTGQSLSLSAQLSFGDFGRKMGTIQFFEPYLFDSRFSLGLNAYATQQLYRVFQRDATGVAPTLGYSLTPDLRISIGHTIENLKLTSTGGAGFALDNFLEAGLNSAMNASITYDTRDNRLFPSNGQYHRLHAELADSVFGSELEFLRTQLIARKYQPIVWGLVLKLNAEFGWVYSAGKAAPMSERFFPGGIYSVRGFEPRSLGFFTGALPSGWPDGSVSQVNIGGDKQAIFNVELEFPLLAAAGIKGVLFADAGNAYKEEQGLFYMNTRKGDIPQVYALGSADPIAPPLGLYYSVGFGFRWFSPIGPLRFEWGIPLTKKDPADKDLIFEFTIGNFF